MPSVDQQLNDRELDRMAVEGSFSISTRDYLKDQFKAGLNSCILTFIPAVS